MDYWFKQKDLIRRFETCEYAQVFKDNTKSKVLRIVSGMTLFQKFTSLTFNKIIIPPYKWQASAK